MERRIDKLTDKEVALRAAEFAMELQQQGEKIGDITNTLVGLAVVIRTEMEGTAATAAWLRTFAKKVEEEEQALKPR